LSGVRLGLRKFNSGKLQVRGRFGHKEQIGATGAANLKDTSSESGGSFNAPKLGQPSNMKRMLVSKGEIGVGNVIIGLSHSASRGVEGLL
jgi:hypothetical protein